MSTTYEAPIAVLKIGGALLDKPDLMSAFWQSVHDLRTDMLVVVVHGGGPQATRMALKLGHEPVLVQGRRKTSDLDLSIMHWTLCGELNTLLVAQAEKYKLRPVGLTGIDGHTVQVVKRPPWTIDGMKVDFGWVGDIRDIDTALLTLLLSQGYMPLVAPLGIDDQGNTYNVNADTVAQSIATALNAHLFCMVAESGGVRRHALDPTTRIEEIDYHLFETGKQEGWIRDGMIVKLKVAFEAYQSGIQEVQIVSASDVSTRTQGTRII